jgi:hypothetical protein
VPFSEERGLGVIRSRELDKVPGSDGFSGRFYVPCWHMIKHDVMESF